MSDTAVIEAEALTKRYGRFTAVDRLDLAIRQGEVFGLLGPNGSGKTTTILMLLGLTEVTEGKVRVVGLDPTHDPLEVKRRVAYMPDTVGFYDGLSGRENLRYTARLAGIERDQVEARITEALTRLNLADVGDKRVGAYSRGMRQRLGLAEVLMKRPDVAILDEPTAGLDPQSTHALLDIILGLKHDGITVVLSSHLLNQVQRICDRVGLFNKGRLALEGTIPELVQRVLGSSVRLVVEAHGGQVAEALTRLPNTRIEMLAPNRWRLTADRDYREQVSTAIQRVGGQILALGIEEPSLDEVYTRYFEGERRAA
ncbi:MAG: ABC transporter ATP-binding protein [Alphaproteobacteria bacterium]|nr:ABC transporter ATP-binding protein [Alphaproteobacteria bacterium]